MENKLPEARLYRIYPNEEQQQLLIDNIEYNREMHNVLLNHCYESYITELKDKFKSKYNTKYLYNEVNHLDYKEQKEIAKKLNKLKTKDYYKGTRMQYGDTSIYRCTLRTLKQSFSNHFKNPKKFGMPRFYSYKNTLYSGSYTANAQGFNKFKTDKVSKKLSKSVFKIAKIGDCKIVNHYPSDGKMFKVTFIRKSSNEWYVACFYWVEKHTKVFPKSGKKVGIDFNVDTTTALALSDGKFIERPKVKKLLSKLDWESSKLGKKRDKLNKIWASFIHEHPDEKQPFDKFLLNCKNYQKLRLKVARIHQCIRRIYDYWIKTTASKLSKLYDTIAIEDLKASNMIKNHKLARALAQSHFRELRTTLEYKMEWSNKTLVAIDPRYTTQTCSDCGYILDKSERLTLSDREWDCPACHTHHIRDTNAARNILQKGIDKLKEV